MPETGKVSFGASWESASARRGLLGCLPIPQLLKHWGLITWHYGNADQWGGYFIYSTPNQRLETRSANQSALSVHASVCECVWGRRCVCRDTSSGSKQASLGAPLLLSTTCDLWSRQQPTGRLKAFGSDLIKRLASLPLSLFFFNKHWSEEGLGKKRQSSLSFPFPSHLPFLPASSLLTITVSWKMFRQFVSRRAGSLRDLVSSARERFISGWGRHRKSPKTNGNLFQQPVCRRTTSRKRCETHNREGEASQGSQLFLCSVRLIGKRLQLSLAQKNQGSTKKIHIWSQSAYFIEQVLIINRLSLLLLCCRLRAQSAYYLVAEKHSSAFRAQAHNYQEAIIICFSSRPRSHMRVCPFECILNGFLLCPQFETLPPPLGRSKIKPPSRTKTGCRYSKWLQWGTEIISKRITPKEINNCSDLILKLSASFYCSGYAVISQLSSEQGKKREKWNWGRWLR